MNYKKPRPITKKLLEKDIQKQIVSWLEINKIPVSVTNSERVWGKFGGVRKSKVSPDHPDLTLVLPVLCNGFKIGLACYIEVKTKTGAIRDGQRIKLRELADNGALCMIARTLDEVVSIIVRFKGKELDQEKIRNVRTLLELNLSDRRSKDVKDALKQLDTQLT